MADAAALERLREVFRRGPSAPPLSDWFYSYHSDLTKHGLPFEVYVRKAAAILRDLDGPASILDLGAGFGVIASLLRILGAPRVVALDYHLQKARDAAVLVRHLGLDGVSVLQGDATALAFRAESFDAVIALASLSHIRDGARALGNAARVLRPGGRLYVFEDNNSSHPRYHGQMSQLWEGVETGCYAEGVPPEKHLAESFRSIRRRMIAERFPGLPAGVLDACAAATRGLWGRQIFDAVEEQRRTGRIDNPRAHLVCNPVSGEYEEYPLNPALVKDMLRAAGFEPRLRSPYAGPFRGRARVLKRIAAGLFRVFPFLLPRFSEIYAVVGTLRPGERA